MRAGNTVVVGLATPGDGTGNRGFRWTAAEGMMDLGMLSEPGAYASTARGVSANGTAGTGWTGFRTYSHASRWTMSGGVISLTDLGVLPAGTTSYGYDISDDGTVVVGYGSVNGSTTVMHAFRWTTTGGMADLGTLSTGMYSYAYGVSGNGLVVVGSAQKAGNFVAFRWTAGTGMESLGTLKPNRPAEAWGANSDGSVVVGNSGTANGDRAFRWTNGRMTDLGTLSGLPNSYGFAVSGNGAAVVGYCGGAAGDPTNRAFLWTSAGGMLNLNTYLPTLGIDLTGWTLYKASSISTDGLTIVGSGLHNGGLEAWIAHLAP